MTTHNVAGWLFGITFLVIGILNAFLIHPVPGICYLLLSLLYLPPATTYFKKKFKIVIPFGAQVILGIMVLWGTLAVGELAELAGL